MSLSLHPSPSPDIPGLRRGPDECLAGPGARSSLPNRRLGGIGKVAKVAGSFPKAGMPLGRAAGPPSRRGRVRGPKPGRSGERVRTSQKVPSPGLASRFAEFLSLELLRLSDAAYFCTDERFRP